MAVCNRARQYERALHVFDCHVSRPDLISFNTALHACANLSASNSSFNGCQWERSLALLKQMELSGPGNFKVNPDATSYTSCIIAAGRAGQW